MVQRPHWQRRTPRIMFEEMRVHTDRQADALVAPVLAAIERVRATLAATAATAADEFAPVVAAVAPQLEAAARGLLLQCFVPGDAVADRADDASADLAPTFDLTYEPSLGLRWAFTQVRMMDVAAAAWRAAAGRPTPTSFEQRLFLPEALADDPS